MGAALNLFTMPRRRRRDEPRCLGRTNQRHTGFTGCADRHAVQYETRGVGCVVDM
jgi:hypothetical protein